MSETVDLSELSPAVADIVRLLLTGEQPRDPSATIRELLSLIRMIVGG